MLTSRLHLAPFTASDAAALLALFRDAHVRHFLLDDTLVDTAWVDAEIAASNDRFARGSLGLFTARLRQDNTLVGFVGLRPFDDDQAPQLLYALLPAFTRRGLATEMAQAIVDAAFLRSRMPNLPAAVDAPNRDSERVLRTLGFTLVGRSPGPRHEQLRFALPRTAYRPRIRPARPDDAAALRHIHTAAFGRPAEADLVEALLAGGYATVSLVATLGDDPVAHILFTKLPLVTLDGTDTVRGVALAPIAVLPDLQRCGLGAALIEHGLTACREAGAAAAVVLGHPDYYPRFGFSADRAKSIQAPWSGPAFMAQELTHGTLDERPRIANYAEPFLR